MHTHIRPIHYVSVCIAQILVSICVAYVIAPLPFAINPLFIGFRSQRPSTPYSIRCHFWWCAELGTARMCPLYVNNDRFAFCLINNWISEQLAEVPNEPFESGMCSLLDCWMAFILGMNSPPMLGATKCQAMRLFAMGSQWIVGKVLSLAFLCALSAPRC